MRSRLWPVSVSDADDFEDSRAKKLLETVHLDETKSQLDTLITNTMGCFRGLVSVMTPRIDDPED